MTNIAIINLISERPSLLMKEDFMNTIKKTLSDKDITWIFERISAYAITQIEDENSRMNLLLSYDEFGLSLTSIVPYRSFINKEVKLIYAMHMINLLRNYSDTEVIESCLNGVPLSYHEVMEIITYIKEVILYIESTNGLPKRVEDNKSKLYFINKTIKLLNIFSRNLHKTIMELADINTSDVDNLEVEFDNVYLRIEPLLKIFNAVSSKQESMIKIDGFCMTDITRRDIINKVVSKIFTRAKFDEYLDEGYLPILTHDVMENINNAYARATQYKNSLLSCEDTTISLSSKFTSEYIDIFEEAYATIMICRRATDESGSFGYVDDPDMDVMASMMSRLYTELGIDHRYSVVNYTGW